MFENIEKVLGKLGKEDFWEEKKKEEDKNIFYI